MQTTGSQMPFERRHPVPGSTDVTQAAGKSIPGLESSSLRSLISADQPDQRDQRDQRDQDIWESATEITS